MKLLEALETRHSVRDFSNKSVKWDKVLEAIDAANHAPFAGNFNYLQFMLVEDQKKKNVLAEHAQQAWVSESQWIIIVCSDHEKLKKLYDDRADRYAHQAAGAAVQNILLRLTELGIGSCWVGAYADELIKRDFKIPTEQTVEAIIAVGYSRSKKKVKKAALETKIHWGEWGVKKKPAPFEEPPRHQFATTEVRYS
jgi:nitroreductase